MQKENLINEMAEAVCIAAESPETFEQLCESDKTSLKLCMEAALAAIQKDYVIVEKSKIEVVEGEAKLGDLIAGEIWEYSSKKKTPVSTGKIGYGIFTTGLSRLWTDKIFARNGKPAIYKTDIVGRLCTRKQQHIYKQNAINLKHSYHALMMWRGWLRF